jgi:hypothetical protein
MIQPLRAKRAVYDPGGKRNRHSQRGKLCIQKAGTWASDTEERALPHSLSLPEAPLGGLRRA